jgi:hypothetical protein
MSDNTIKEALAKTYVYDTENDPENKFLYENYQAVRLKNQLSSDGQTPIYWDGATVVITKRLLGTVLQEPCYQVLHVSLNKTCKFKQEEIAKGFKCFLS